MKSTSILLLIISYCVFTGCNDYMNETTQVVFSQTASFEVEDFVWENTTRTISSISSSGVSYFWLPTDTIGIYPSVGSQIEFVIGNGEQSASAAFDGGAWSFREGYTYTAFYPFDYYNRTCNAIKLDYSGQKRVGNDDLEHSCEKDFIYSSSTTPEGGITHFSFKHLGSFLWLNLTFPEVTDISEIKLVSESNVFPIQQTLDLTSGEPVISTNIQETEISIKLSEVVLSEDLLTLSVYMIMPQIMENVNMKIIAETFDGKSYNSQEEINFESGLIAGTAYKRMQTMILQNPQDINIE